MAQNRLENMVNCNTSFISHGPKGRQKKHIIATQCGVNLFSRRRAWSIQGILLELLSIFSKHVSGRAQHDMKLWIRYSFVSLCFKGKLLWASLIRMMPVLLCQKDKCACSCLLDLLYPSVFQCFIKKKKKVPSCPFICSVFWMVSSTTSFGWAYLKFSSGMNGSVEHKVSFRWKHSLNVGDCREK